MDTKLIIVEGLPGCGKSTLSRFLSIQIERNKKEIIWFYEVLKSHPTNFFHEACLTETEFNNFLEQYEHTKTVLQLTSKKWGKYICIDLLEIKRKYKQQVEEQAWQALSLYDIKNFNCEKYIEVALEKWKNFIDLSSQSTRTVILEASLYQYQIHVLLLFKTPKQKIKEFIHQIENLLKTLNPTIIYLYHSDFDKYVKSLIDLRGEEWITSIIKRDEMSNYFRSNKQNRLDTYLQFLMEYKQITEELYAEWRIAKKSIDTTEGQWKTYELSLLNFFSLDYIADPAISTKHLQLIEGRYTNDTLNINIDVTVEKDGLIIYLNQRFKKKLIPKNEYHFYIEDLSVELIFFKEKTGNHKIIMGGIELCADWARTGIEYIQQP